LGNTSVVAGISAEVGRATDCFPIVVNLELTPLCSASFHSGVPSEKAQTIAQLLNKLLQEHQVVGNTNIFTIQADEYQWYLYVDLYCLDYDGNILDACAMALFGALRDCRLREAKVRDEGVIASCSRSIPLEINTFPIPVSFGVLEGVVIADPTAEEEELLDTELTLLYSTDGAFCGVLKPGGIPVEDQVYRECMKQSRARTSQVLKLVNAAAAQSAQ